MSIRFDWRGNGSSAALEIDDIVDSWVQDLAVVHAEAQSLVAGLPVHCVGLRVGASLVAAWGGWGQGSAILWEPVSGKQYLRIHQRLRVLSNPLPPLPASEGVELNGTFFTPAQAESLRQLKAPKEAQLPHGAMVLTEQSRDEAADLYFAAPRYARIPYASVDRIVELLAGGPDVFLPPPSPRLTRTFHQGGRPVEEAFVTVGPHGLHGIVARPLDAPPRAALAFTSAGGEPLDGPTGLWSTAARLGAAAGIVTLRVERRGLGVHLDLNEPVEPNPYTEDAVDDVVETVTWLRDRYSVPIGGVGLCVGAWLFLRAATRVRLQKVLAIDNVVWTPSIGYIARFFKEPFIKRFLTERADLVPAVDPMDEPAAPAPRTNKARVKAWLKRVRDILRRRPLAVRKPLARMGLSEYPWEMFSRIVGGTCVHLHFSEPSRDHFTSVHGAEALKAVRGEGRIAVLVDTWSDLDHSLFAAIAQERVLSVLRDELAGWGQGSTVLEETQ